MSSCKHLVLLPLFLTLLTACQQVKQEETVYKIGFSQCCDDPWRDVMNGEVAREIAEHPELKLERRVSRNNNEQQVEDIRELVASGIDILLVSPNESGPLTEVIEEVYSAGIPVILMDRKIDSELFTSFIGADNHNIGKVAANYLREQYPTGVEIIEIQLPLVISPARERTRGFNEVIVESPKMEIVATLSAARGIDDVADQLPSLLEQHPTTRAIFGHTDLLAEYAHKVLEQAGMAEEITFVGVDGIPGTGRGIQAVEDGLLDASLLYPTGGTEAVKLALAVLEDLPFQKENLLGTIVIDQGNAPILHNQMKRVSSLQQNIDEQLVRLNRVSTIYQNQQFYLVILASILGLALFLAFFLLRTYRAQKRSLEKLELQHREISENEQQLRKLTEEVQQATRAKVDFFTRISHEFRTPLTLILGYAEDLLLSRRLGKEEVAGIGHIQSSAQRLLRLVNQLMNFRKAEGHFHQLAVCEVDLVAFTAQIVEAFLPRARKQNIALEMDSNELSLKCWFDPEMMDKVLFNLLSNALKFTPEGQSVTIGIRVNRDNNQVAVSIRDTGLGMSQDDADNVFEPFYQGAHNRKAGTGLGLALVKSFVELHQGTISLETVAGKGSNFIVTLPLGNEHFESAEISAVTLPWLQEQIRSVGQGEDIHIEKQIEEEINEDTTAGLQLLIIEDNKDLQRFLVKALKNDYQLIPATDGMVGLQLAKDRLPDLVICDLNLPGKNGLEIVRELREDISTSHIPILMLTAQVTVEDQVAGLEAGVDAYLTKPFNVQFLRANIASLLRNRLILQASFSDGKSLKKVATVDLSLPERITDLDRDFLERFVAYVDEHFGDQNLQISDLSKELGLSRSQLYRKVNSLLGESVGNYIERVRMNYAEIMLKEGKLSIADTAFAVGYSSPDYFSSVFKNNYNVSPSQFRKNALKSGQ